MFARIKKCDKIDISSLFSFVAHCSSALQEKPSFPVEMRFNFHSRCIESTKPDVGTDKYVLVVVVVVVFVDKLKMKLLAEYISRKFAESSLEPALAIAPL